MIVIMIQVVMYLVIIAAFATIIIFELNIHKGNKQIIAKKTSEEERLNSQVKDLTYKNNGLQHELGEEELRSAAILELYNNKCREVEMLLKTHDMQVCANSKLKILTNEYLVLTEKLKDVLGVINSKDKKSLPITLDLQDNSNTTIDENIEIINSLKEQLEEKEMYIGVLKGLYTEAMNKLENFEEVIK